MKKVLTKTKKPGNTIKSVRRPVRITRPPKTTFTGVPGTATLGLPKVHLKKTKTNAKHTKTQHHFPRYAHRRTQTRFENEPKVIFSSKIGLNIPDIHKREKPKIVKAAHSNKNIMLGDFFAPQLAYADSPRSDVASSSPIEQPVNKKQDQWGIPGFGSTLTPGQLATAPEKLTAPPDAEAVMLDTGSVASETIEDKRLSDIVKDPIVFGGESGKDFGIDLREVETRGYVVTMKDGTRRHGNLTIGQVNDLREKGHSVRLSTSGAAISAQEQTVKERTTYGGGPLTSEQIFEYQQKSKELRGQTSGVFGTLNPPKPGDNKPSFSANPANIKLDIQYDTPRNAVYYSSPALVRGTERIGGVSDTVALHYGSGINSRTNVFQYDPSGQHGLSDHALKFYKDKGVKYTIFGKSDPGPVSGYLPTKGESVSNVANTLDVKYWRSAV